MGKPRTERFDFRLSDDQKEMISQAAALMGQSASAFALGILMRAAGKVVKEASVIKLSARDRDRFLAALDKANARPNAQLIEDAKRYRQLMG